MIFQDLLFFVKKNSCKASYSESNKLIHSWQFVKIPFRTYVRLIDSLEYKIICIWKKNRERLTFLWKNHYSCRSKLRKKRLGLDPDLLNNFFQAFQELGTWVVINGNSFHKVLEAQLKFTKSWSFEEDRQRRALPSSSPTLISFMTIIILYQTIAVKKVLEPLLRRGGIGSSSKNTSLNLHLTATYFNE